MLSRTSREDPGAALVGIGGLLLFVSLFLNWYEPGRSAWTVFEVWDLVLAVLAVIAVVGSAGRLGIVQRRSDNWLTGPAVASFLIVLVALINHPPAATGAAPMFGLWLALFASIVMLVGVAISVAGISVAVNLHPHAHSSSPSSPARPAASPSPTSAQSPSGAPTGPARHAGRQERGRWFRHLGREHHAPDLEGETASRSPSPQAPAPARAPSPPASSEPPPAASGRRAAKGDAEPPTQVTEPQRRPGPGRPSS
jgi:hypothetical protein